MDVMTMIDAPSALIVIGGTVAATVLRCGFADCATVANEFVHLTRRRFNADATRAELASHIQKIQKHGLLSAPPPHFGDAELDDATAAMIEQRSISALVEQHERHKRFRVATNRRATQSLMTASELAPVFGLAGTLISLNQVVSQNGAPAADGLIGAISMAVVTTLYGLLAAHLIFAPLARCLERRAAQEEDERDALIAWLSQQLLPSCKLSSKPVLVASKRAHHAH